MGSSIRDDSRAVLGGPIGGSAAWRREDLDNDRSWLIQLDTAQAAELDQAEQAVRRQGLRAGEFTRDEFPVPTLEPVLARILDDLQHGRGIAVLRGLPIDGRDEERASRILWGIGCYLGRGLTQSPHVNLGKFKNAMVGYIVDQGLDPKNINVHGSSTSVEQRAHCDPSDLVALLCVRPAIDGGGKSAVVSAMTVYNELLGNYPEILRVLHRGFYHDLRTQGVTGELKATPHPIPVYSYFDGCLSVNFNARTIETGAVRLGRPLPDDEAKALQAMERTAKRQDLVFEMTLQSGDLQLLNNYTMLHSRTSWCDVADPAKRRFMMRLWLRTLEPRPLAPGFGGGYVTGTTYDVAVQTGLEPLQA